MKKIILSLGLLLALGVGCVSFDKLTSHKTVAGDWHLAFDLPNDWVMVESYSDPLVDPITLSYDIDRGDNQVILQNVNKPLVLSSGVSPQASVPSDSYILNNGTRIRVTFLDSRRLIPSEAEDLGSGFFRVMLCEEGADCQIAGRHNYDFYLVTDTAKFKFEIQSQEQGNPFDIAQDIVLSAEVVTQTSEAGE